MKSEAELELEHAHELVGRAARVVGYLRERGSPGDAHVSLLIALGLVAEMADLGQTGAEYFAPENAENVERLATLFDVGRGAMRDVLEQLELPRLFHT